MSLLDHDFDGEYDLSLSAWGEGVLREEELLDFMRPAHVLEEFRKKRRRYPKDISLLVENSLGAGCDYGYTSIDPAFLENLKTLKELILPPSVTSIDLTPALREMLCRNETLIRGTFDSYAEELAKELGLRYRPSDFVFAEYFFEPAQEYTAMKLIFTRSGAVYVSEDISSPGSSSSHTYGGSFTYPLRRDFYKHKTAEQIAGLFRPTLREATVNDGRLAAFLEKARARGYYTGKN